MTTDHIEPAAGAECEREPGPSDSLRTFGAVVQALCEHAGLSRAEFGELVRFSRHTVESVGRVQRHQLTPGHVPRRGPAGQPGRRTT